MKRYARRIHPELSWLNMNCKTKPIIESWRKALRTAIIISTSRPSFWEKDKPNARNTTAVAQTGFTMPFRNSLNHDKSMPTKGTCCCNVWFWTNMVLSKIDSMVVMIVMMRLKSCLDDNVYICTVKSETASPRTWVA